MSDHIGILVVDDHNVVRKGLCSLLSDEKYGIEVLGEGVDGADAVDKALQLDPEVILMDLMMPKMNGVEAAREILQQRPEARILILTSYAEDDLLLQAIDAGALGYLMKDASPDELVSAIKSVHMNRLTLPMELAQKVMRRDSQPEPADPDSIITERERDVLVCVSKGLSNKQIARELTVSITTVRTHVSSLLRKLDLENRTQLALYARENEIN